MPKRVPKRVRETLPGRLQRLQDASKAPPRTILEVDNLESMIFEGCTVRNHKFWKCQGAPRTHQERSNMPSRPSWRSLRDNQKWTAKLNQVKNHFLRRNLCRGSGVFEPRTLEMAPQLYIYIYIYIFKRHHNDCRNGQL